MKIFRLKRIYFITLIVLLGVPFQLQAFSDLGVAGGASISFSVDPLLINWGLVSLGETIHDTLTVNNTGDQVISFQIEVTSGGNARLEWIKVIPQAFTLTPNSYQQVAIEVTVPEGASPGGHFFLITTKPVDKNQDSISLGAALTTTVSFTVKGTKIEALVPDDLPRANQEATLIFHNYQDHTIMAKARFLIYDGATILLSKNETTREIGSFSSENQSYQAFWEFSFDTLTMNGTYLAVFEVKYHPINDSSKEVFISTQETFIVGYLDGTVDVSIIESREAFSPTVIKITAHNKGTLPFNILLNASLKNLDTGESFGNYHNQEIQVPANNDTEVLITIIPPEIGNYSLLLEYQYLGRKESRTVYLSVFVPASFPSVEKTSSLSQVPAAQFIPFNDNNSLMFLIISSLGGTFFGFAVSRMLPRRKYTKKTRLDSGSERPTAKLLAFLVQRADGTDLYSRRYSTAIDFDPSLLSGLLGSMEGLSAEIFHGSKLKKVELEQFQVLLRHGRFVNIIFLCTEGDVQALQTLQQQLLGLIEGEGRIILEQMLVDSQELEHVWTRCEELIRHHAL